jgi:putative ABC transport system substrate-binding protein
MNKRREILIALGAGALAAPLRSSAQPKMRTVGYLSIDSAKPSPLLRILLGALNKKGYVVDRDLRIDDRTIADYRGLAEQAAGLVRAKSDLIVTFGSTATLAAAKVTKEIPIVMIAGIDPVTAGLAVSLAHPGGNISGVVLFTAELAQKRTQMLRELVPNMKRIGVLSNPAAGDNALRLKETEAAARLLKLETRVVEARELAELEDAFAALARAKVEGVVILSNLLFHSNLARVAEIATRRRLPAIYNISEFVEAGGLINYGVDFRDAVVKAATHVDRILKGARPGDLPIEQPTKFELVINGKTAKTLGLKIPQSLLIMADKVIE